MTHRKSHVVLIAAAVGALASLAPAQQTSAPVTLQWFESSWRNIERRTVDFHAAGYGALWTPPPGRAVYLPQGGGIGYDPYDRFDLGRPRDPTLYGTEGSYKSIVRSVQKTGGNVYVDYVHHHVGSFDMNLNGYTYPSSLISQGYAFPALGGQTPYLRDRADYPGFELTDNFNTINSPASRDTYAFFPEGNPNRPFGSVFEYWFRLGENLVTIDLASQTALNRQFVRNPVPGFNNIRQSPQNWQFPTAAVLPNGQVGADTKFRQANVPGEENRRFYPDTSGPARTVIDGGQAFTVYDFNPANPSAGDPVNENSVGYMMRYAQWLTQVIGVDGLRIDAARHVPLGEFNTGYNPQSLDVPKLIDRAVAGAGKRLNLDGSVRSGVFQFQEVFNYNSPFLASFIRKPGEQPVGDTVNPNRDVLDFSMWAAMAQNMGGNGLANNWHNIRTASVNASKLNTSDPNVANNGQHGIGFVYNHDEGVSPPGLGASIVLDNVAHAWVLMRPGNAYVYYRSDEFNRVHPGFFLKQGRGDALGGRFGQIITRLVDTRNSYGRGDFKERWIDNAFNPAAGSAVYVFERENAAIVGLNIGYNPGSTTRTVQTGIPNGTWLEEVSGQSDLAANNVRKYTQVVGGQVAIDIPWNNTTNGNKGYAIYGLPLPRGSMAITDLSNLAVGTLAPDSQTVPNGTARINAIDVVTTDQFKIRLNTSAVALDVDNNPGSPGIRDFNADGDVARFKINDGSFDGNGNGVLDYPSPAAGNATKYGFESFLTTNSPGFGSPSGNGAYEQIINAAALGEGYHYITTRAWRRQGAGESEVFKDSRSTIYVDRLPPVSAIDSTAQAPHQGDDRVRDIRVESVDKTADSVHVLMNLGAALTDAQVLALVSGSNKAEWIDSNLFGRIESNVGSGNHAITTVTYEPTGRVSVQRFPGRQIGTSRGLGLGDVNFDNGYGADDVTAFEAVLYSQDQQFNPASDLTADGRVNNLDLYALPGRYASVLANVPFNEANNAIRRRGDFTTNHTQPADAGDIDDLFTRIGSPFDWKYDLDASGGAIAPSDMDTMLAQILGTRVGDANLDAIVNIGDFSTVAANFNTAGGWAAGSFNGDGIVNIADFALLAANFNQSGPLAATLARTNAIPEPASGIALLALIGLFRRCRTARETTS